MLESENSGIYVIVEVKDLGAEAQLIPRFSNSKLNGVSSSCIKM
jgi:hypothetical protein